MIMTEGVLWRWYNIFSEKTKLYKDLLNAYPCIRLHAPKIERPLFRMQPQELYMELLVVAIADYCITWFIIAKNPFQKHLHDCLLISVADYQACYEKRQQYPCIIEMFVINTFHQ